jgi:hypothetical protein
MKLHEELYFEITVTGIKSELKKLVSFVNSGELDDFFEFSSDFIIYDDDFASTNDFGETSIVIANEDYGIEIDEFDPEDFLDVFCKAAKALDVQGNFYDIDDEEYRFVSPEGNISYVNAEDIDEFNDELDAEADAEEAEEKDYDEY